MGILIVFVVVIVFVRLADKSLPPYEDSHHESRTARTGNYNRSQ